MAPTPATDPVGSASTPLPCARGSRQNRGAEENIFHPARGAPQHLRGVRRGAPRGQGTSPTSSLVQSFESRPLHQKTPCPLLWQCPFKIFQQRVFFMLWTCAQLLLNFCCSYLMNLHCDAFFLSFLVKKYFLFRSTMLYIVISLVYNVTVEC